MCATNDSNLSNDQNDTPSAAPSPTSFTSVSSAVTPSATNTPNATTPIVQDAFHDDALFFSASPSESSEDRENNETASSNHPLPFTNSSNNHNFTNGNTVLTSACTNSANPNLVQELTEAQALDRRTQSVPTLVDLRKSPTVASTSADDAHNDDDEAVDCVVTETLYHLHSKNLNNANTSNRNSLPLAPPVLNVEKISSKPPLPSPRVSRSNSKNVPFLPADMFLNTNSEEIQVKEKTLLDYGYYLMGLDYAAEMEPDSDPLEDAWTVATKRRGVYNLIQVPLKLERLLWFVVFICCDEFLSMFTFLPLRAAFAVLRFQYAVLTLPFSLLPTKQESHIEKKRRTKARVGHVIDVLHMSILVFTASFLTLFDISWVYHNIRGQSVIKLYVVFNVMEIFDRLCSSFGVDMLDSLGWTTASAVSFLSRGNNGGNRRARAVQAVWLVSRVAFDYVFALAYATLHAALLLVWVVTLNVAINTTNHALLTLLIANNFVELKGSVFKNYKVQNVFQIACSDGVERFQLAVFLGIMLAYTSGRPALLLTWATIFACEVLVDWIKHAFSTKFNRIPHRVYSHFSYVIAHDIAQTRTHAVVRSVGGSAVAKRIGFVSLPLAALTARMVAKTVYRIPPSALAMLFAALAFAKLALSIALTGHAQRRIAREQSQPEEDEQDAKWTESLATLNRYDLIAKT